MLAEWTPVLIIGDIALDLVIGALALILLWAVASELGKVRNEIEGLRAEIRGANFPDNGRDAHEPYLSRISDNIRTLARSGQARTSDPS